MIFFLFFSFERVLNCDLLKLGRGRPVVSLVETGLVWQHLFNNLNN